MRAIAAAVGVISGVLIASGCSHLTAQYTTTPETTGGLSLESPRVEQIALARTSNSLFSIFPAHPGTKKCGIPAGGVRFKPWPGTCTTGIRADPKHEPGIVVTFTEKWNTCLREDDCVVGRNLHHRWQVIERDLKVVATRQSGATAPQYYK